MHSLSEVLFDRIVTSKAPANRKIPLRTRRRLPLLMLMVLSSAQLFSSACISPKRTPNLERIFAAARTRQGKRPIIVIPGILGTQLIDSKTGEMIWPSALRSSAEGAVLPMTPDLAANRDDIVPGKIIETVKFAKVLPEVYVYL